MDIHQPLKSRFSPLKDLEKSVFNILGEHRNWCPWVVAMEMQSHNESLPGWKMLLYELLPATGPAARQTLLDVSTSETSFATRIRSLF